MTPDPTHNLQSNRAVGVDYEGWLSFSWSCDEAGAREAIGAGFDLLVAILPRLGLVSSTRSIEVCNPEGGKCVRRERIQRLTRDIGSSQAVLLRGEHLEHGKLRVNDTLELDLELDFRKPRDGSLEVLLADEESATVAESLLPELARQFGFSSWAVST